MRQLIGGGRREVLEGGVAEEGVVRYRAEGGGCL